MSPVLGLSLIVVLVTSAFLQRAGAQNVSQGNLVTTCGEDVEIPTGGGYDQITVNLTHSQGVQTRAVCSWVIPALNASTSNQVVLTLPRLSSCMPGSVQVWEVDPSDPSQQSPLEVECTGLAFGYTPVVSAPGFSLRVLVNTSLPSLDSFPVFFIIPVVWTDDRCPRTAPRTIVAPQGSEEEHVTLNPQARLITGLPHNLACHWALTSTDQGLVRLQLRTFLDTSGEMCSDSVVLRDAENSSSPVTVPLCSDERVRFDFTSTTGSAFVTSQSGSSGVSPQWYLNYWSVDACPQSPLRLAVRKDQVGVLKGRSRSAQAAGHDQPCVWNITTYRAYVVKLIQLDNAEFLQDCDAGSDTYLILNGEKVDICDSSKFPIWSESNFMEISFHSNSQAVQRSFVLNYTATLETACQGHPVRKILEGSQWTGNHPSRLRPIPPGDETNGHVCQWLYVASDEDNVVRVRVDWTAPGSPDEDDGVNFDKDACSYANFRVYSGRTANSSTEVTPSCPAEDAAIVYVSATREMLFVYSRDVRQAEPGFLMAVRQIPNPATSGSDSRLGFSTVWKLFLPLLAAVVVSQ